MNNFSCNLSFKFAIDIFAICLAFFFRKMCILFLWLEYIITLKWLLWDFCTNILQVRIALWHKNKYRCITCIFVKTNLRRVIVNRTLSGIKRATHQKYPLAFISIAAECAYSTVLLKVKHLSKRISVELTVQLDPSSANRQLLSVSRKIFDY